MKFVEKLVHQSDRPTILRLELFTIARALLGLSVNVSRVDQGIEDAQNVLEAALKDLGPMLRETHRLRTCPKTKSNV
jgi:hypothetical protein